LIWRGYYLVHLPTFQKKIRVLADWILDIFFKRDVTMLKTLIEEEEKAKEVKNSDHHRHNYNT
jgi:hypothetical protein